MKYNIIACITKCCQASITFYDDEDHCLECGKIINDNDYYKTELTIEEYKFFNLD